MANQLASFVPELRTHAQKVCSVYKKALRLSESYYVVRYVVRYHAVLIRAQFDKNKCVCDPKEQRRLLWLAQDEVFMKQNPLPSAKFSTSYGLCAGIAAERVVTPPDWIIDYWHPLEKAHYPCYFYTREKRKCEYIQHWHKGSVR